MNADLTNAVWERLESLEPQIRALLPEPGRRERLRREAAELEARFPNPANRPPLCGMHVGVKDIIRVDGFETRCGSSLPPELFAGREAECVTALRKAGALILGKTVTTEFAFFEPGPTRNPHNLEHTPGGSSSGSAAAVAAGYCPLALGTQTIGSTIRPAAFCGIVGFKPSFGRISTRGVIPFSESVDTVGVFARDVEGITRAAPVLCSDWKPGRGAEAAPTLSGPTLGVPEGPFLAQASPEALAVLDSQIARLRNAGYTVKPVGSLPDIAAIKHRHMQMIAAEMAHAHREWFAKHESLYRSRTAALIREGQNVGEAELVAARASRSALRVQLERLMTQNGIDLWLCPAAIGPAPKGLGSTGDPAMSLPWTHAGMPSIALPAGRAANGLPLGMQLVGRFMDDELLLYWAGQLEMVFAQTHD
jgi:Asp-tRNA(Asn)/Glu-tRNA(Gln) amidotransferase A subunit family amidase